MNTKTQAAPDFETRVNDARRAYIAATDAADAVFSAVVEASPEIRAADEALENADKTLASARAAAISAEQERRAAYLARDAARAAALDTCPEYQAATAKAQDALAALESAKRALFRSRR